MHADQVILMHAVPYAAIPNCRSADFGCVSVSFDNQQIAALQPYSGELPFGDTDSLDLAQDEPISKHIRHTEVWFFQRIKYPFLRDL